jgi:hypothetical protein
MDILYPIYQLVKRENIDLNSYTTGITNGVIIYANMTGE